MLKQNIALILQGGGALGSYQAGVYEQLHLDFPNIGWVIGTSIGAINGALIAGNPPETRLKQLHGFWAAITNDPPDSLSEFMGFMPWMEMWQQSSETVRIITQGIPGFFKPRGMAALDIHAPVHIEEAGFYNLSPLRQSLEKFVDFDYLNKGHTRLSVCAVDVETSHMMVFDNRGDYTMGPEHIMASGALPPGFPPVVIAGRAYWDGGIFSNTPLEVFLSETEKQDALCFMVDLWDPTEALPRTIAEVSARAKTVQYASRAKEQLMMRKRHQDLQRAIRVLVDELPAEARKRKDLQGIIEMGCDHTISVVQLIMKSLPGDDFFKDIDFSSETITARWNAGMEDARRALKHQAWLKPLPPHAGLVLHELQQEDTQS